MKHKQLIRQKFRDAVFKRDKYSCVFCGETKDLDAHHITDRSIMPNGGYVKENGITVCKDCHRKCEKFHESGGKSWTRGMHPTDLYEKIGSSLSLALDASTKI